MRLFDGEQMAIDFDAAKLARSTDPATSHAAAARVHEFGSGHIADIRRCLALHGPLTADQIALHTELDKHQICRRLPEMESAGIAAPTGDTRASRTGRQERVWGLTDA